MLICIGCAGEKFLITDVESEIEARIAPDLLDVSVDPGRKEEVAPPVGDVAPDLGPELPDWMTIDFGLDSEPDEPVPEEGGFLWPCTDNADCMSGYCLVTDQYGTVCTVQCLEECPSNWICKGVDLWGDVLFLCVPPEVNLCQPCEFHGQCGGQGDLCLEVGIEAGKFCTLACGPSAGPGQAEECPEDYVCTAVELDGDATWQCWPESDSCICLGDLNGAVKPCLVENEFGKCFGEMTCNGPYGWTQCNAATPAAEFCNGLDDDCDGEKDEPEVVAGKLVDLCNDGNECTDDECKGTDGCYYMPLAYGECFDANPCTVGDHCEDGVCIGTVVSCDDENPCTDDSCDELAGCVFTPNSEPCIDYDPCTTQDYCEDGECTGLPIICDDGNPCTDGVCQENGVCSYEPAPDGTPCSTDPGWVCVAGECVPD